ncbi:Putative protein C2orf73 like protein [Chelonia mydas]|uniref:Uncharacterized protein n=1 Tax=Chelonia mydas TaxID=8469 RepID=M7B6K1_CHEMY|nr:Putative protein C2orf73 like protein [Chelonia mydas]
MKIEKVNGEYIPKKNKQSFQHSYLPEWRNNPQPRYAKLINTNVRFLNEPIYYMETEGTMAKKHHWWPSGEPCVYHYSPPYDRQSTQRNDFQKPTCTLSSPTKYSSKLQPSCGIVPLAIPRTSTSLPAILQERTSFIHQYNARKSPNEPIRGKTPYHGKHGACSDHRDSYEHCKHHACYPAVYAEPEPAKAGEEQWQCGDETDEDMDTDFSQSMGPGSLAILVAMG